MSYVIAVPEMMTSAATDLAAIGSNLNAAHMVAAAPTVAVLPAAADEVSASIAHLMSGYGQEYQAMAAQATAFNDQFVQHLTAGASSYASAEAILASLLQDAIGVVNANPVVSLIAYDTFSLLSLALYLLISPLIVGPILTALVGLSLLALIGQILGL
jgi:hypothetical protein